jgi:hypothetical protein
MTVPPPNLPAENRELSPYTGLTRDHWCGYADFLLRSAHRYATADHANIHLPGASSAYGPRSDSLEAFARTFLMASFRMAGEPESTGWLAEWYAQGLDAGTDPGSPGRWPTPGELGQAKVEAASLAVGLALTRDQLWDKLPERVKGQLIAWFETVIGEDYPPINWVWFQIVVETFLASVGGRSSAEDIEAGLAVHDSLYRGHGWFADGPERAYDHYVGWAFHVYPQLWAMMAPGDPRVQARGTLDGDRLADYLDDAVHLVGANGSPLIQGRSLTYRFAAAAPFWVGELFGHTRLSPGTSRRAASGMLDYFARRGAINEEGLLSIGWHGEFGGMKQSYSGAGSPYWAAKGMLGLALPASHRVWTAIEEPLPVELGDTSRLINAPGWMVNGTQADGVVRITNHGTDHARQGDRLADSALYARLGYSTHSFPDLASESLDNAVVLVDDAGRLTHRTGFATHQLVAAEGALEGSSGGWVNWIAVQESTGPDHGSGVAGAVTSGPEVTVTSVTRGSVEIRTVLLRGMADCPPARLRIGGWPLDPASDLTSMVVPLEGEGETLDDAGSYVREEPQPMGNGVVVPWVGTSGAAADGVYVAVVGFGGRDVKAAVETARLAADSAGSLPGGR